MNAPYHYDPTGGEIRPGVVVAIDPARLAELERAEQALKDISSGSPALFNPGTPHEFKCSLCHAHIDHARRVLGYQPWPAVPHTRIGVDQRAPADDEKNWTRPMGINVGGKRADVATAPAALCAHCHKPLPTHGPYYMLCPCQLPPPAVPSIVPTNHAHLHH
jgi:hypothetical protein